MGEVRNKEQYINDIKEGLLGKGRSPYLVGCDIEEAIRLGYITPMEIPRPSFYYSLSSVVTSEDWEYFSYVEGVKKRIARYNNHTNIWELILVIYLPTKEVVLYD